jgi:hypothetical protein
MQLPWTLLSPESECHLQGGYRPSALDNLNSHVRETPCIDVHHVDLDAMVIHEIQKNFLNCDFRPTNDAAISLIKVYTHVCLRLG